jgi:hypothetical protein
MLFLIMKKIFKSDANVALEKACIFTVLQCFRQKARQGKVNHGIEKPAAVASGLFGARQASSPFCTAL